MAEKGVEEQVLAMERLRIFFFLVHFWNCSHFTVRYELIIRSETGNILRDVICFHLLSKFH